LHEKFKNVCLRNKKLNGNRNQEEEAIGLRFTKKISLLLTKDVFILCPWLQAVQDKKSFKS